MSVETVDGVAPSEQAELLGELKRELDEERRDAVKAYVERKLQAIAEARDEIEEAKAECSERIEECEETISEAEKAIKAVEDGNFEDALKKSKDRLTELPQTASWIYYTGGSTIVA